MSDEADDFSIVAAAKAPRRKGAAASGSYSAAAAAARLSAADQAELADRDTEIREVEEHLARLRRERNAWLAAASATSAIGSSNGAGSSKSNGAGAAAQQAVDYSRHDSFEWSGELLPRARQTWPAVQQFRFDQQAVCNAALDGRDTVVVMPTGGGKSLCYQLPAILDNGLTLVISPLISLSYDQCLHLREAGVSCEMLSSMVPREEQTEILRRVKNAGRLAPGQREIKVLFVTPEKIAKSKTLVAACQGAYTGGRLSRIVIDEAHCCSQMGHDFRPDYKGLSKLRLLYPSVPIMALSATLAPTVLEDVRKILGLAPMTPFAAAAPQRTVYFGAPLHRPNLRYRVVPRDTNATSAAQDIVDWIAAEHGGHSGIVYCLSKKDAEVMAEHLSSLSKNRIRSAWYHADLEDADKMRIHRRWRSGDIHVVCSTVAFGMGIDLGTVRFVIHASPSKSLDSYLQESGRAGRDGGQADCVLFYRPQDASRVAALVTSDRGAEEKLSSMIQYAQSHKCRKVLFREYFRDAYGNSAPCGTCDNCTMPPELVDVTFESWQLLRTLEEVHGEGGRVTLPDLCSLARGLGGGQYNVISGGGGGKRRKSNSGRGAAQSGFYNVEQSGGKLALSKDDAERLATHLVTRAWLAWEYNATAYTVNVYVKPGPNAGRLTALDEEAVRAGAADMPRIETALNKKVKRARAANGKGKGKKTNGKKAAASSTKGKRKRSSASDDSASDSDSFDSDDELAARDADVSAWSEPSQPKAKASAAAAAGRRRLGGKLKRSSLVPASEADDDDEWEVFQASEAASSSRGAAKAAGTSRGGARNGGAHAEAPIEID